MVTPYQQINSGAQSVEVSVAGTAGNIISTTPTFVGATNYSFLTYGSAEEPAFLAITDVYVDPGAGMFSIRAVNAATGVKSVDVYVTPPGADLNIAAPNLAGVGLGTASLAIILPVGNYEIRVTSSGTKEVIYDTTPQSFAEHSAFEAVVYTKTSSRLVGVTMLNVDSFSTSITNPNLMAQFKVINGSSVPSPLNVFVNQNLLLSNIPIGGASSYLETLAGSPSLSVEATATPGAPLLTITPNLGPGTDSSILFTGTAGALKALVLSDNNLQPVSDRARVRFVNGTTDVQALDVFVNFSKQVARAGDELGLSGYRIRGGSGRGHQLPNRLQRRRDEPAQPSIECRHALRRQGLHDLCRRHPGGPLRHRHAGQLIRTAARAPPRGTSRVASDTGRAGARVERPGTSAATGDAPCAGAYNAGNE